MILNEPTIGVIKVMGTHSRGKLGSTLVSVCLGLFYTSLISRYSNTLQITKFTWETFQTSLKLFLS